MDLFTERYCGQCLRKRPVRLFLQCFGYGAEPTDLLGLYGAAAAASGMGVFPLGCYIFAAHLSPRSTSSSGTDSLFFDPEAAMAGDFRPDCLSVLPAAALGCAAGGSGAFRRGGDAGYGRTYHHGSGAAAPAALCRALCPAVVRIPGQDPVALRCDTGALLWL